MIKTRLLQKPSVTPRHRLQRVGKDPLNARNLHKQLVVFQVLDKVGELARLPGGQHLVAGRPLQLFPQRFHTCRITGPCHAKEKRINLGDIALRVGEIGMMGEVVGDQVAAAP